MSKKPTKWRKYGHGARGVFWVVDNLHKLQTVQADWVLFVLQASKHNGRFRQQFNFDSVTLVAVHGNSHITRLLLS